MLCPLIRWLISREADTGKKTPGWAVRHAGRCESCRAFAAFAESLPARLSEEVPAHLAAASGVNARRNPSALIAPVTDRRAGHRFFLRPVPVAGLVLVLALALGTGIFLVVGIRRGPAYKAEEARAAFAELKRMTAVTEEWPRIVAAAETSLDKERLILEKAARSAYSRLQDRLNITIGRKETKAS